MIIHLPKLSPDLKFMNLCYQVLYFNCAHNECPSNACDQDSNAAWNERRVCLQTLSYVAINLAFTVKIYCATPNTSSMLWCFICLRMQITQPNFDYVILEFFEFISFSC